MSIIEEFQNNGIDVQTFINQQTKDIIQSRLMSYVSDEYDKSQGSFMFDTITPNTFEFVLMYVVLTQMLDIINPNTTYGEFLKGYASSLGVEKKEAEYATGFLTITGAESTIIPSGTLFSTEVPSGQSVSPKYYSSTQEAIIPESGTINIPIVAEKAGSSQNVRANEIVVVCKTGLTLTSVANPESITNGTDEEDDETLRIRFIERAKNPPSSGNKRDYERWSKETPNTDVDEVIVEPLWAGPGTVKLTIICDGQAADSETINKVKQYIDPYPEGTGAGEAPVGAIVTVGTVVNIALNIKIPNISFKDGATVADVKNEISTAVSNYLKTISLGGVVRIVKIESAIGSVSDVLGFDDVLIALDGEMPDYKNKDIQLTAETKTSLGEVEYV